MGFLACLQSARDTLLAADLFCTLDPRELTTLPGVWLRMDGLRGPVLSGGSAGMSRVLVTVFALVPPVDPERDMEALEALLDQVAAVIPPHSEPRHVGVMIPGGGQPAPAMSYTHDLLITE